MLTRVAFNKLAFTFSSFSTDPSPKVPEDFYFIYLKNVLVYLAGPGLVEA